MISEAKAFWDSISGKVKELIHAETNNSMRVQRYDVTTAPNGTVMGVTQPFGSNEVFLPYSIEVSEAKVGDTVLVAWWGSMSNARVYYYAYGYDGPTYLKQHTYTSGTHNLNTFRSPGIYYFSGSTTLTNAPTGSADGFLLVFRTDSPSYNKQVWLRYGNTSGGYEEVWTRIDWNNTFSEWRRIDSPRQITYTSGTRDLNTFTTPGLYYFSGGTTLSNNPGSNGAGWLIVLKSNASVYKQIWLRNSASAYQDTYVRIYSSSSWATWKQLAPNMAWKKLWTNASPSSAFAAQTVQVDLSEYDAAVVMFYNDKDSSTDIFSIGYKGGADGTMLSFYNYRNRRTYSVTATGVTFANGQNASQTGSLSGNSSAAIPVRIYGVRGVS